MFSPQERAIFDYHDGFKAVKGDPLAIRNRLLSHPQLDQEIQLANLQSKPQEAAAATERLVSLIRQVFKLKPYDEDTGNGLTDGEALGVLGQFVAWMEDLVGELSGPQTSLPTSAPESSNGAATHPTTDSSLDSTSTASEPSPAVV